MRFRYDYDFGDNWRHDVLVERIEFLDAEDWVAPRCLDSRRACPPEDCGVSGYDELLEALRDPHHDDHERLRTWVVFTLIPNSSPYSSSIRPLLWSKCAFPF
jgi:hypothetical protein